MFLSTRSNLFRYVLYFSALEISLTMAVDDLNNSAIIDVKEDNKIGDIITGTPVQDKVRERDLLFWLPHKPNKTRGQIQIMKRVSDSSLFWCVNKVSSL